MNRTMVWVGLAALATSGLGCPKKEPDGQNTLTLQGLPGLTVQAPAETKVSKNAVGIGVMLKGPGVSMTIGTQLDVDAKTLEEAKKNAESYSPADMSDEQLSDGYILTYTSKGDMGTNYWLVGRRKIGDTAYSCGVSSPKKEHQQSAIAICKSLKKK